MFLDTSGLLCLLDQREPRRLEAENAYRANSSWVTHGYVLFELVALGESRGVPSRNVVTYIQDLLSNPDIEVVWPDEFLASRALLFLSTRLGRGYSLCDAMSFVLMRERGLTDALTTDSDFAQEGFHRLLV